jgi:hypothetical protein
LREVWTAAVTTSTANAAITSAATSPMRRRGSGCGRDAFRSETNA